MEAFLSEHLEILLFFFAVAVFYSSVGFGGGSSYLAILALYSFDFEVLRSTALLCNIVVVLGSSVLYSREGLIQWKRVIPLIAVSIPLAFLGGALPLREHVFFFLLATVLLVAGIIMWFQPQLRRPSDKGWLSDWRFNSGIGGGIGILSGMVGIGGGIFLSPVLHLTRWASPKVIAGTAAIFILVNSVAGLSGQIIGGDFTIEWAVSLPLMICVGIGGQIGSRLGIFKFRQRTVKRATALLIVFVSARIFLRYAL